jgi:hypothetical protein
MKTDANLTGKKFGRLFVKQLWRVDNNGSKWLCFCDCGNLALVSTWRLMNGWTKSCGCIRKEVTSKLKFSHGQAKAGKKTKLYMRWWGMRQRCENPNNKAFKNYGGRGIKVCDRWHIFENFAADMGNFSGVLQLDRINNDGNYEPANCRWATPTQQANNRRKRTKNVN